MNITDLLRTKEFDNSLNTFTHQFYDFVEMNAEKIDGKRYYETPTGEKYPSMTTILSLLENQVALNSWRKRIGYAEAEKQTQEAADRGNRLHELSEKYLLNTLDINEVEFDSGDMMFRQVKPLLDEIQIVHAVEVPLYSHKYKFAGRTDAIVTMNNNITIVDHKNSKKLLKHAKLAYLKEKLYKYQLQAFGYATAFEEMTGIKATHGALFVSKPKLKFDEEYESELITWSFDDGNYKQMFEYVIEEYYKN